jgi:hypothetical protein
VIAHDNATAIKEDITVITKKKQAPLPAKQMQNNKIRKQKTKIERKLIIG